MISTVFQQHKTVLEKNGIVSAKATFSYQGKQIALPMTSTYDVITIAGYWFGAMKKFLDGVNANPHPWTYVVNEGGAWVKKGLPDNSPKMSLETYLALPGYNLLNSDSDSSHDRFLPYTGLSASAFNNPEQAAALRGEVKKDIGAARDKYLIGTLYDLYSSQSTTADVWAGSSYNTYIRGLIPKWESLIRCVIDISKYNIPGKLPGEKFGELKLVKLFWETVASIAGYMDSNSDAKEAQTEWSTYLSNAGKATKNAAETIIKETAEATGKAAGWAANQAGSALGAGGRGFLGELGLWGLAFVSLIIFIYIKT